MTTPEVPSAAVAKGVTAPKMRFLYPLAAVCIAAVFLAPSDGQAQAAPAEKQQTSPLGSISSTLGKINPIVSPFGGKSAKKLAEAQAVASIAGAVTSAVAQPAPTAQPAPSAAAPAPSGSEEK